MISFLDGLQRFIEIEYWVWFLYCTHPFKCQTRHVCLSELFTGNRGGHLLFGLQRFQQFENLRNFLSFPNCSQIYTNLNTYLWILVFCNKCQILSCFILIYFEKNRIIEKNVITVQIIPCNIIDRHILWQIGLIEFLLDVHLKGTQSKNEITLGKLLQTWHTKSFVITIT